MRREIGGYKSSRRLHAHPRVENVYRSDHEAEEAAGVFSGKRPGAEILELPVRGDLKAGRSVPEPMRDHLDSRRRGLAETPFGKVDIGQDGEEQRFHGGELSGGRLGHRADEVSSLRGDPILEFSLSPLGQAELSVEDDPVFALGNQGLPDLQVGISLADPAHKGLCQRNRIIPGWTYAIKHPGPIQTSRIGYVKSPEISLHPFLRLPALRGVKNKVGPLGDLLYPGRAGPGFTLLRSAPSRRRDCPDGQSRHGHNPQHFSHRLCSPEEGTKIVSGFESRVSGSILNVIIRTSCCKGDS